MGRVLTFVIDRRRISGTEAARGAPDGTPLHLARCLALRHAGDVMMKVLAPVFFGLAPTFLGTVLGAATALAAEAKTIDMGYIDQVTITRACQRVGAVPFTGGEYYGCATGNVKVTCNPETCTAYGRDLTPVVGNSLQAVMDAMDQRAGQRILPLDTRVQPVNGRVRP
jgi:hypothetical protein